MEVAQGGQVAQREPALERGPTAGDTSSARSPHLLRVVTPEGVLLEFRAAGVGSRMLALAIDLFLQILLLILLLIVFTLAVVAIGDAVAVIFVIVSLFLIIYGYPAIFETLWDGRTVGKAVLGIRVITTEGGPVTFRHSAIRAMLATFDFWAPTPGGLVALTSALVTARSQRLGDLAAGTIVVRRPKAAASPVFFAPAYGAEHLSSLLDTSALTPQHYAVVRDFLLRVGELDRVHAVALGDELATRVGELTDSPRPPWLDSHRYLISVLCAHQTRFRPAGTMAAPAWPGAGLGVGLGGPGLPGPHPGGPYPGGPHPGPAGRGWAPGPADLAAVPPPVGPPVIAAR
jgi:uncharacterized RDD family membrane protein YckC